MILQHKNLQLYFQWLNHILVHLIVDVVEEEVGRHVAATSQALLCFASEFAPWLALRS
jgi:hypothetical protein